MVWSSGPTDLKLMCLCRQFNHVPRRNTNNVVRRLLGAFLNPLTYKPKELPMTFWVYLRFIRGMCLCSHIRRVEPQYLQLLGRPRCCGVAMRAGRTCSRWNRAKDPTPPQTRFRLGPSCALGSCKSMFTISSQPFCAAMKRGVALDALVGVAHGGQTWDVGI